MEIKDGESAKKASLSKGKDPWKESPPQPLPSLYIAVDEEGMEEEEEESSGSSGKEGNFQGIERYEDLAREALRQAAMYTEKGRQEEGEEEGWSGESYEKSSKPKGFDKAFRQFSDRVQAWPDQCLR